MYRLIFKPRAISMAKDAAEWYEERKPGLGELFFHELESCFDKLEVWPIAFTQIKKDYRHIVLKTFPYIVVFKIIKQEVVIYAVFHTSRDPRKKLKK